MSDPRKKVYKEHNRPMQSTMGLRIKPRQFILLAVLLTLTFSVSGCVYYNTFHNAKKAFNEAESARKNPGRGRATRGAGAGQYRTAIEKSLKVVENYPNSKYYDDALYVLGVSYYHTDQLSKAERRFRELLANYPDSKYGSKVTLYLAKAKLELGEEADAMVLFESIFTEDYKRDLKAEAALGLGEFYLEQGDGNRAQEYFRAVRDSLGRDEQKILAQKLIGDAYILDFRFSEALGANLQLLGMDPSVDDRYHALSQAAEASYRLLRIDDGLDYLDQLITDPLYYDSVGVLKLRVAEGYEMREDLNLAENSYQDIAETVANKAVVATAYYRLGLIYQFDLDDLTAAKGYYDKSVETNRGSEAGQLSLQRSSDIGKLKTFALNPETISDTTLTQDQIDQTAYTQYLLGELYWFQLNKPDSAIAEMVFLVDSFPTAYDAPRGLIALSQMYLDYYTDSSASDSLLHTVLTRYPNSDYVPEALELLDLKGTAADTGYAERYVHMAEDMLDEKNYDSSIALYRHVAERFPDSRYSLQARFNALWVEDEYLAPGDSSLVFAYQEIVDSFSGTEWAAESRKRLTASTPRKARDDEGEGVLANAQSEQDQADDLTVLGNREQEQGSVSDVQESLYRRPNGDTLIILLQKPTLTEEQFIFPEEAYSVNVDVIILYFQILLDFSGRVIDLDLRVPSQFDRMNENAIRTVRSMTFDPLEVTRLVEQGLVPEDPNGSGHWFVYKYEIKKPDILR